MLGNCFGSDALKKTTVYEWHERFRSGRESVEDDERSGRPSTSKTNENINKVREMLISNRKLTIRELAEDLNIAYGSVQDIIVNDLGLRRVAAKLVPKELNFMQKRDRVDIAKDMISDPTFIKRIITGDETWVYEYDTQSRHQASEWRAPNEPRPKKPRRFQSKKKVMLTVFMDYNGIVHHEFLPEGQIVNKEYYLGVIRRKDESENSTIISYKKYNTMVKNSTVTLAKIVSKKTASPDSLIIQ
ncbi:histone-lysine N-methyltransferase SETMAR-like [Mycetomoellerius zeteki]|uniref:histone-lysine N-methyltransferase SETMAR-like n=1 Tax=Mycetomoellerius zeteki TaxID=64791 RepID=UPI00084E5E1A|nr:PREDICTED: histone-lysine N-methyltransferase SETMAR-like [Trachymyrmex zeteki]